MKSAKLGFIAIIVGVFGTLGVCLAQDGDENTEFTGNAYRIIVSYKLDALKLTDETAEEKAQELGQNLELKVEHLFRLPNNGQVIMVWDPEADRDFRNVIAAIEEDPAVRYAELDSIMRAQPEG